MRLVVSPPEARCGNPPPQEPSGHSDTALPWRYCGNGSTLSVVERWKRDTASLPGGAGDKRNPSRRTATIEGGGRKWNGSRQNGWEQSRASGGSHAHAALTSAKLALLGTLPDNPHAFLSFLET